MARLVQAVPDAWVSVSATTRSPRAGEVDGVHYQFKTKEQFQQLIDSDGLLEWAVYGSNHYGTPKASVQEHMAAGQQVILEIDVQGAFQIREKVPEAHLIFIEPPSMEVLEQRVAQKRAVHDRYRDALAGLPLQLPAEPGDVRSNRWLTAALLAPDCGVTPGQIIAALAEHNIEARHIWKPMHLQPVFHDCAFVKTAERSVAEDVFARGICLPSDTKMTPEQQAQVCAVIRGLF